MRIRRTFNDDFKRQIAEAIISGQVSQLELSRKYGITPVSLGHVGIDGSKFHASTSKHKAASYSHLKANENKLKREIEDLLKKAENADDAEDKVYRNGKGYSIPDDLKIKEKRLEKIKKIKKELLAKS